MLAFTELRKQLENYLTADQIEAVFEAYQVAFRAHDGQTRVTGEPYITHPIAVAQILAGLNMDVQSIMAALLHDVIEDTDIDKNFIIEHFGPKVADLVDGVSKLTQISFESRIEMEAENFRKMMLAMNKDLRVVLIKMADRLHNMRTIGSLPFEKKRRIARETLEIYAPIASRLGMNNLRVEFEELGFQVLYPLRYRVLQDSVKRARGNRQELLATIETGLQEALKQATFKDFFVFGREKHLYSLYQKMQAKRLPFSHVMDVYAFRIVVNTLDECYRALGVVHNKYRPVTTRLKDYIAIPKANGYQSLHTSLMGPYGVPIEIQIRTKEMDLIAEKGIASHWSYKSPETRTEDTKAHVRAREWLKGLLEIQAQTGSSSEFLENVKIDLYPGTVYVFTPKGRILSLPQGATPVDFAYLVHTDIGNTCVACKINRHLAPLSSRLVSGQTVDIMTVPSAHPNPAWLSFSITGKARSNIRHWLKMQKRTESQQLGRRLINGVLAANQLMVEHLAPEKIKKALKALKLPSLEDLYEEVGLGKRLAPLVAKYLMEAEYELSEKDLEKTLEKVSPLMIKGTEGLVVTYAKCCYPIPGDLVQGYLLEGQGVVIHVEDCPIIQKMCKKAPQKCLHVQWEQDVQGEFQVEVVVDVINDRGVLAILANAITESNANIIDVRVDERDGHHNTVRFLLDVRDRAHLARVLRRVRTIGMVTRIARAK